MPTGTYHFPPGFLWGAATAAHQVEGGNTNNTWYAWEQQPGRIHNGEQSGRACAWWEGRWKEDFDRAAECGQNAHRLSVEWSRIQPAPGRWDEDAIDRYRAMLRGLQERGMTPMVTLHHFADPLWLAEQGGWENDATPAKFAAYVTKIVEALKEYVSLWVTINEPNVFVYSSYVEGTFPPGKKDMNLAFKVVCNLLRGHAMAYHEIHRIQPEARVAISHHCRPILPERTSFPPDVWMARFISGSFNDAFADALVDGRVRFVFKRASLPEVAKTQDFFGVNYYTYDLLKFNLLKSKDFFHERRYPPNVPLSDGGYIANLPEGMFRTLKWAHQYNLPILVTENGVNDAGDHLRPAYLVEHIHQMWRAVQFNWQIKGYFHWTLVDNFEWERGWGQRFGLWGLDQDTQARIRRPSVDLYAAICKQNAISSEMVQKYAPQSYEKLFPG